MILNACWRAHPYAKQWSFPMNQQSPQKPATPAEVETTVQDLQPQEDVKGGVLVGLLLPAVQKVRSAPPGGG